MKKTLFTAALLCAASMAHGATLVSYISGTEGYASQNDELLNKISGSEGLSFVTGNQLNRRGLARNETNGDKKGSYFTSGGYRSDFGGSMVNKRFTYSLIITNNRTSYPNRADASAVKPEQWANKGLNFGVASNDPQKTFNITGLTMDVAAISHGTGAGFNNETVTFEIWIKSNGAGDYVKASELTFKNISTTPGTGVDLGTLKFSFSGYTNLTAADINIIINRDANDPATVGQSGGDGYAFNNISLLGTESIPEPTTATLSLLGLGALAFRRRRA